MTEDQEPTTQENLSAETNSQSSSKLSPLYRLRYAAHTRCPALFRYPVSPSELETSRMDDAALNEETSLPDGELIDLCCFWAVEFYTPAHIDALYSSLRNLGWDKGNGLGFRDDIAASVQMWRQRPDGRGWLNLGVIRPPGKQNSSIFDHRKAPLPAQVQFATGGLYALTSSITCVVIGFVLGKNHSTRYNEAIRTDRQTYTKPLKRGYRVFCPETQKSEDIGKIRSELSKLASDWFSKNLPGLFSSGILGGALPTCEFVTLRQADPFPKKCEAHGSPSRYLSVMDLYSTYNAWYSVNTPGLKFAQLQRIARDSLYHSILAIREDRIDEKIQKKWGNQNRSNRIHYINDKATHLLSRWAVLALIDGYSQRLNAIRDSSLLRPKSSRSAVKILKNLGSHVSLSVDIAAVGTELNAYTKDLPSFCRGLEKFKHCNENVNDTDLTLDRGICDAIEKRASWLQLVDKSLRDQLTQYGSLLGARENTRLQRRISVLTIVIMLLTFALFLDYNARLELLQWFRNLW